MLIESFNSLVAKGINAILLIIGGGFDSKDGEKLKAMSSDSVYFLGQKTNIGDYLFNADVFALSSSIEGMPITLLESMLCGVPMVSTPVCGAVDVIDGENGVLSDSFSISDYTKALQSVIVTKSMLMKE